MAKVIPGQSQQHSTTIVPRQPRPEENQQKSIKIVEALWKMDELCDFQASISSY